MKKLVLLTLLFSLSAQATFSETQAEWNYHHKPYCGGFSRGMYEAYYGPGFVPSASQWDECSPEARRDIIKAYKKKNGPNAVFKPPVKKPTQVYQAPPQSAQTHQEKTYEQQQVQQNYNQSSNEQLNTSSQEEYNQYNNNNLENGQSTLNKALDTTNTIMNTVNMFRRY